MNIENLEQLDDRVVAIKKNKTHLSHSKEGFLIRNQHKQHNICRKKKCKP